MKGRTSLRWFLLLLTVTISSLSCAPSLFAGEKGAGTDFSKEWLRQEAKDLSSRPYAPPTNTLPEWVRGLDWDQYQSIRYLPNRSLWRRDDLPFQLQFFHLGLYFHHPVGMREVIDGKAYPIPFSTDLFAYGPRVEVPKETGDLGYAGFRIYGVSDLERDVVAFLGASYFRAVGKTKQYGLSARGLAVDTGLGRAEEFPWFKSFWLERPAPGAKSLTVHALLDSPSVAGAYTFTIAPGDQTVMDVETHLFPRTPIERIEIAPLTSMFQNGENDRRVSDDFRPEIHDSDGLQIWTGAGEWIWRPLVNPPYIRTNSFLDDAPRGFGLLQRDRDFNNYQDDGACYHARPSLWVETLGNWGRGAVQLVELSTADETLDNIVAYWNPAEPVQPGKELSFRYRLHWGSQPPVRPSAGEAIATRIGAGGIPGEKDRMWKSRKFVIDFKGGRLGQLGWKDKVEPVITVSRGRILHPAARPIELLNGWRCNFDLLVEGTEPVDLRCFLRDKEGALTETWLYQWTPPSGG
jgi:periplasmic glucans biosynthesis protein